MIMDNLLLQTYRKHCLLCGFVRSAGTCKIVQIISIQDSRQIEQILV